jgi:hypothetical protein
MKVPKELIYDTLALSQTKAEALKHIKVLEAVIENSTNRRFDLKFNVIGTVKEEQEEG